MGRSESIWVADGAGLSVPVGEVTQLPRAEAILRSAWVCFAFSSSEPRVAPGSGSLGYHFMIN